MQERGWTADTESGSARKRTHEAGGVAVAAMETAMNYQGVDDSKTMGLPPPTSNSPLPDESHTRSLVKGVTWRFLATTTTVVIAYFVTGEVAQAFKIGFVEFFAKLAIYYMHERAWAKIRL